MVTAFVTFHGGAVLGSFHRDEDYEIPAIQASLADRGNDVIAVAADYSWHQERRIRLYYLWRTLQVAIYGENIFLFRTTLSLLMTLSIYWLALFFMRFGISAFLAIGLALLTLVNGARSIIWWRMGAAENFGIFFLIAALMTIGPHPTASKVRGGLFVLLVVCSGFSKESFLVVIPAMLALKLWAENSWSGESWPRTFRRNTSVIACLVVAVLAQLSLILFVTGAVVDERIGVEGFDPVKVIGAARWVLSDPVFYVLAAVIVIWILIMIVRGRASWAGSLGSWGAVVALMIALLPTAVLYQKTGVPAIYYYPMVLFGGIATTTFCSAAVKKGQGWITGIVTGLVLTAAAVGVMSAHTHSRMFLEETRDIARATDRLADVCLEKGKILFVGDPVRHMESMNAMRIYLSMRCASPELYYLPVWRANYSVFDRHIMKGDPDSPFKRFEGRVILGPPQTDPGFNAVLVQPYSILMFLAQSRSWFNIKHYSQEPFGRMVLLTRIETNRTEQEDHG